MAIRFSEDKQQILHFLTKHQAGVLATASAAGRPHAATVYFSVDDKLNFYFVTKEDTTKHHNLQANPYAALAVHDAASQATVQATGQAKQLDRDDPRAQHVFNEIVHAAQTTGQSVVPPISQLPAGKYVTYRFTPARIRLAEFNHESNDGHEKLFDEVTI